MNWIFKNKKTPSENLVSLSDEKKNKAEMTDNFVKSKIVLCCKSKKAFFAVLFFASIFSGSLFLDVRVSSAETTPIGGICKEGIKRTTPVNNSAECSAICVKNDIPTEVCKYTPAGSNESVSVQGADNSWNLITNAFTTAFKALLIGVLTICGWLFGIAATLFDWAINPANISAPGTGILQKAAVKDVWIMVRDLLNMTFILVLLFAAFCTIFQVSKWNIKAVWLNILINALLVNFSYPIARFFIDVSNVAFYYLVNHLFTATSTVTGSGIFAMFGATTGISELLSPNDYAEYDISYLIAIIVFVFIMGMTLLIVAALFIVRLVALTMIVMFSPIGFVGYIFPATSKYASDWWTALFSYSFFAPIMIFFMALALRIMEVTKTENFASMLANANVNAPADQASWIANAALFVIPVIILWMGMGVAKKFGIEGADTVVNYAKKKGKWLANAPGHYSGVYGGTKKAYEEARKSGKIFGMQNWATKLAFKSGVANREAGVGGFITGGPKGWKDARNKVINDENRENIDKDAKKLTDSGMSVSALNGKLNGFHTRNELNDKEWKEQAAHAKAYMAEQADDRKLHIQNNIAEYGDLVRTDPVHLFRNMDASQMADYQSARTKAEISHAAITNHDNGTVPLMHGDLEGHVKQVAFFANKAAKEKLKQGVNAANRK